MTRWNRGEVVENYHWNERLCSLKVAVDMPRFEAGQFVRVGLEETPEDSGSMLARPYSMVNAPDDPILEIYFNRVLEGPLSPCLHALTPGDPVWVADMVAGFLVLSEVPDSRDLWLLSTGTAIGPFLSMLKTSTPWQRFKNIVLVHGVRTTDELVYLDLIQRFQTAYSGRLIKLDSVTREQVPGAIFGRIPAAIESGELESLVGLSLTPDTAQVMVCGNPGMVEESVVALMNKGLQKHRRSEPGQITVEVYK